MAIFDDAFSKNKIHKMIHILEDLYDVEIATKVMHKTGKETPVFIVDVKRMSDIINDVMKTGYAMGVSQTIDNHSKEQEENEEAEKKGEEATLETGFDMTELMKFILQKIKQETDENTDGDTPIDKKSAH